MLHLRVLQDALGAEELLVILAEELNLLGSVCAAVTDAGLYTGLASVLCGGCSLNLSLCWQHGETSKYLIINWQVLGENLMVALIVGTLDYLVLGHLLAALEAEGVTTWQRQGFLILVVVGLEANTTLENRIHSLFF
jgi:hypothetical protein